MWNVNPRRGELWGYFFEEDDQVSYVQGYFLT